MIHKWILGCLILIYCLGYWLSPFVFSPVPWPDDSAFYLPGVEWILSGLKSYKMHAQAAFVPTYDIANFNTMPGLPFIMGLMHLLGLGSIFAIRLSSVFVFGIWVYLFLDLLNELKIGKNKVTLFLVASVLLTAPAIRWGAMIVRPEIWQGLFWLLLLIELSLLPLLRVKRIAIILAGAAYIHFEAIFWVPALVMGILIGTQNFKQACKYYCQIALYTLLLLSPWITYVFYHWDVFWVQMQTQFGRLAEHHGVHHHPWIGGTLYGLFHSLFVSLGQPVPYPKWFNAGKIFTWFFILFGVLQSLIYFLSTVLHRKEFRTALMAQVVSALFGFLSVLYLWISKPETWFTIMVHMSIWPMVFFAYKSLKMKERWNLLLGVLGFGLIFMQTSMMIFQYSKMKFYFSRQNYSHWIQCIDEKIGGRTNIWQPHWPDVLVELSYLKPKRDYTRAVDFQNIQSLLDKHALRMEVIIHSIVLEEPSVLTPEEANVSQKGWWPQWENYSGEPRPFDERILKFYQWLPFREYSALSPQMVDKKMDLEICQNGPFWAALSLTPLSE